MRLKLLMLALCLPLLAATAQNYSLHSATKGVKVESGRQTLAATPGMPLKAIDYVIIPDGGSVEVYNSSDSRIYKSVRPGKVSISRLVIEARQSATDKLGTIVSKLDVGAGKSKKGNTVFVEKGVVNRSLAVYDPEGEGTEMNTATIGRYIASKIKYNESDPLPDGLVIEPLVADNGGSAISVTNTLGFPVYLNILNYEPESGVQIAQLGQPGGSYVLLTGQAIERRQLDPQTENPAAIVFVTPRQFDLDKVIEEINANLKSVQDLSDIDENTPVVVKILKNDRN